MKGWDWNSYSLEFDYTMAPHRSAVDSVFKSVNVKGAVYDYFYDAFGRRRLKEYPTTVKDEFFHDTENQLLADQGNDDVLSPSYIVVDDYVWLDGRPVALFRGRLSDTWTRQSDSSSDCARNGEEASCGVYFPVTDHIGKPVLMLDASAQVTGVGEYNTMGRANWVPLHASSPIPYAPGASYPIVSELQHWEQQSPSIQMAFRFDFHAMDTLTSCGSDVVTVHDGNNIWEEFEGDEPRRLTDWLIPDGDRIFWVDLHADQCSPKQNGVLLEGYQYRMWQDSAAGWFFTPLRFPGQYYDEETGLHENWNRYYDPGNGRYLQPEPMLEQPSYIKAAASGGRSVSAYAYAHNNPLRYTDPTGLYVELDESCQGYAGGLFERGLSQIHFAQFARAGRSYSGAGKAMYWTMHNDDRHRIRCDFETKHPRYCAETRPGKGMVIYIRNLEDPKSGCRKYMKCPAKLLAHEIGHVASGYSSSETVPNQCEDETPCDGPF